MKIKTHKTSIITLTLLLAFATFATTIQFAHADVLPTYTFLSVNPNPIGVDQQVSFNFWLDKVTPDARTSSGSRWEGLMVKIEKPDGTVENKGPFKLDAVASGYTLYTPKQVGKYYITVIFPGQHITGMSGGFGPPTPFDNEYEPSTSSRVELTVQEEPIAHWVDIPLPTGYWTRPLNAELRGVSSIASYWLATGSTGPHGPRAYGYEGNFQPYGDAPDTGHVLWTREIAFGGPVGGQFGDIPYYPGETYERKFQPPIIMNGRLYYNERLGSSSWLGAICVDLYTGEEIWRKPGVTFTMGQLLDLQTPNQHGIIPYIWSTSGSTYTMYDPFSGEQILELTGVPSGSMVTGKSGEILIYTLSGATNRMTLWNSTLAINPTIDTTWSWRPTQSGINVTAGYMWNVTVPDVPGSQSITKINPDYIYSRATIQSTPTAKTVDLAYDIRDGKEPVMLWSTERSYDGSIMNGPMHDGVFTTFVKEQMVWYGYDVKFGTQLWGPTEPYPNGWGMYQPYADTSLGYGKFFAGGYDGTVHCYDIHTGENLWNYHTGSSGFETPYGSYPFKDNALTVADGKVFAVTNEHSPNTPYFHGWKIHAIDVETGECVWNMSFMGLAPIIADGYALSLNYFDNRIYCFGPGQSETTVTVSPKIVSAGSAVMIEGNVMDKSPGAPDTPAISDEDMSAWMEYLYEYREIPGDVNGVEVMLSAIGPNGEVTEIGTVTSDMSGMFKKMWNPTAQGEYTIVASFAGSKSYGGSYDQTALGVTAAAAPSPTIQPTQPPTTTQPPITTQPTVTQQPTISPSEPTPPDTSSPTEVYIIAAVAAVVIFAAAAGAFMLRRRK